MPAKSRPTGVTIVGALYFIMAALAFVAALGYLQWAGIAHFPFISRTEAPFWLVIGGNLLLTYLGLIVFLVAVVDLIMAIGCFRGWGWVWSFGVVLVIINIVLSMIYSLSQELSVDEVKAGIIGAFVPIVVLAYLSTRKVRAFFGKA
ncbi:MAG: hypothetical protein SA339_09465 [Methanomassiliicoccus sp.]|nr:hypothetical protein [Methanomassiliicoccus sp.]